MKIMVTARHCDIDDGLRDRAVHLIARIAKLASRPHRAEVVFDRDHNRRIVEYHLHVPRRQVRVCTGEASDFRTALDRAAAKLRRQLDKKPVRTSRRPRYTAIRSSRFS